MRIKKTPTPKHESTTSPFVREFVKKIVALVDGNSPSDVINHLSTFPVAWPFPRGDLYHWIPALNKFDEIYDTLVKKYKLKGGPQTIFFEGEDEILLLAVIDFSRMLVEECGNRSIYASSSHLSDLMNTISLKLLLSILRLASKLGQRYYGSRSRTGAMSSGANQMLLNSHYNINIDKVSKMAAAFAGTPPVSLGVSGKVGKSVTISANDLTKLVHDSPSVEDPKGKGKKKALDKPVGLFNIDDFTSVQMSYWVSAEVETAPTAPLPVDASPSQPPATPTPMRRKSNLHKEHNANQTFDEAIAADIPKPKPTGMQFLEIPKTVVQNTSVIDILKDYLPRVPQEHQYELLQKVRVAKALADSVETRRQILGIRILAITNLAYVHPEQTFQAKVLSPDNDEPRRLQIVYQLAELVNLTFGQTVPRWLQTLVFGALEALSKHKIRTNDINNALSVNVNHGTLLSLYRKIIAELEDEVTGNSIVLVKEDEEWRRSLVDLVANLPQNQQTAAFMVNAGLIPNMVSALKLRTIRGTTYVARIAQQLDMLVYGTTTAFASFTGAKGLDVLVDLIHDTVQSAMVETKTPGGNFPTIYKSPSQDFETSYFRAYILKIVFKFMHHMIGNHAFAGGDRPLRNLVDSPILLEALRLVIANGNVFGSTVWSTAVQIVATFIHNEPTSYTIIHEAKLSHTLLASVTGREAPEPIIPLDTVAEGAEGIEDTPAAQEVASSQSSPKPSSSTEKKSKYQRTSGEKPAAHILPSLDVLNIIPVAFEAMCLQSAGVALFKPSDALETFFEIFESEEHVRVMVDSDTPTSLGAQFDELVRHHPQVKKEVLDAIIEMVRRVLQLGKDHATLGSGAKIWFDGEEGKMIVSGGRKALAGDGRLRPVAVKAESTSSPRNEDVEMPNADAVDTEAAIPVNDIDSPEQSVDTVIAIDVADEIVSIDQVNDDEESPKDATVHISTYIDVMARFLEGFIQQTQHSKEFVKRGGFDIILEIFFLSCLPHDFATRSAAYSLGRVIHFCGEINPAVVMPVLLNNAQRAVAQLDPFLDYEGQDAFFRPLADQSYEFSKTGKDTGVDLRANGTKIVKDLVTVHALCSLLGELFSTSLFTSRQSNVLYNPATQQKYFDQLIPLLGKLHRVCVWEEIILQEDIPDTWNEATKAKERSLLVNPEDDILGANGEELPQKSPEEKEKEKEAAEKVVLEKEGETACFKNVKTIRFLLSQIPNNITPFLQGLARTLIIRRTNDLAQKQQGFRAGDLIAQVMYEHLTWKRLASYGDGPTAVTGRYKYWIIMLSSIQGLLLEGERSSTAQILTTILITFQQANGIEAITDILKTFWNEIKDGDIKHPDMHQRLAHCLGGCKVILALFSHLVNGKPLTDSQQTQNLQSRDRLRERPDYFNPAQFLVELRLAILPAIQSMWDSPSIDKAFSSIAKSVIDILGIILKGEHEDHAFKRADKGKMPAMISWRRFEPDDVAIDSLTDMGFARQTAVRALVANNNNIETAIEWLARHPEPGAAPNASRGDDDDSDSSEGDEDEEQTHDDAMGDEEGEAAAPVAPAVPPVVIAVPAVPENAPEADELSIHPGPADLASIVGSLDVAAILAAVQQGAAGVVIPPPPPPPPPAVEAVIEAPAAVILPIAEPTPEGDVMDTTPDTPVPAPEESIETSAKVETKVEEPDPTVITVDDLNDARNVIREDLITRSLDVLQVHHNIVFELATLIMNSFSRPDETTDTRREVVSTVAQSLMSLQEDDIKPMGKTISATAHFLGLLIQNADFFNASLEDLKDQIPVFASYIKVYPNEPAPWVAKVLLIVEKLLTESAQPKEVKFLPHNGPEQPSSPPVETGDFVVELDDQEQIFSAIMAAIPSVGKDEATALAIVRVLVLLTRKRKLAIKMAEMQNMHRLFHMLKALAGSDTSKIQSSILLILRHVIEDDATIKTIMCTEIRHFFSQRVTRGARQVDTAAYIRHTAHLVHRSPEVFVEATNDLCKLTRFDSNARHQQIALKEVSKPDEATEENLKEAVTDSEEPKDETNPEESKIEETKPEETKQEEAKEEIEKPVTEMKAPGVIQPDGVVHYLLSQLLACKDIDLNEGIPAKEEAKPDVEMGEGSTFEGPKSPTKPDIKPEFKPTEHPTYLYRCFLLQALTEILQCYNRSKIEFINFSRKAMPRDPITPSKPRSGVLNYLLNDLIPVGSLAAQEDIPQKKRAMVSNWAISVIVALCSQTGEAQDVSIDEPDLVYVRKFVLDSTLKSFKDAISSTNETLSAKYGRMLNLSDLLFRMIAVRPNATSPSQFLEASQKRLSKIMFEKNFVATLTAALADVDLNFPHARRAIKYILRPLKLLSKTALDLGEDSDFVPPNGEADEMSIVSELSEFDDMEDEDEREETPDLYRNSALSMFEAGEHEDEDEEASDFDEDEEEEMYEEMDFDEEEEPGSEDSDEDDDDVEGQDMDVEIVMENNQLGVESEDDEEEDSEDDDEMDEDDEGHPSRAQRNREFDEAMTYEQEEEWDASEGEDEEDEDEVGDLEHDVDQVIEHVNRVIGADEILDDLAGDHDEHFVEDGEEDEEEDEDDDDMDDEDAIMHGDDGEIEDDEGGMNNVPWIYQDEIDAPLMTRGHHARSGWYSLNPGERNGAPRAVRQSEENLQNPLLQPSEPSRPPARLYQDGLHDWVNQFDNFSGGGGAQPGGAVSWLTTLMNIVSRGGGLPMVAPSGTLQFRVQGGPGGVFPPDFETMFGMSRPSGDGRMSRDHRSNVDNAVNFAPLPTVTRWMDEMRLAFGNNGPDKAQKIANAILVSLVPAAVEAERIEKEKADKIKKQLEEEAKRLAEERAAKEKAETEEKAAREAEEVRIAAEKKAAEEAAAAEAAALAEAEKKDAEPEVEVDAMEGVEETQPAEPEAPAEPVPRAVVMIRGREMDITGMDIDPEFLEALPEDMREEVLTNHLRERQAATATNEDSNEISQEFLEALPDDIRAELVQRSQADQRRRDRERQLAESGQAQGPQEIDLASFLATLDPGLRQTVLMEQDDEVLATMPEAIIEEAQALRGERRNLQQFAHPDIYNRVIRNREALPHPPVPEKKLVRRGVIKMLDRAGVATLLRLMFVPQIGSVRTCLHEILLNVCENRVNRSEVIGLLLGILQDGSADMTAVERSFAHMTVQAKKASNPKTPQSALKRTNTGLYPAQTSSEMSPLLVAQQCLAALAYLVNYNEHIPSYFLNEHDQMVGLTRSKSKKGKGKAVQSKEDRFALNTLLGLLDRTLIAESTSVMDQLSVLLSEITRPLMLLLKKDKKKEEQKKIEGAAPEIVTESVAPTVDAGGDADMTQPEPMSEAASTEVPAEPTPAEPTETPAEPRETPVVTTEIPVVTTEIPVVPTDTTSELTDAPAGPSEPKPEPKEEAKEEVTKKPRTLAPPVVPDYNLRLVVNIITARECTSKTFKETLTTMVNLSAIPGAKEVFGAELIRQAQALGGSILEALADLKQRLAECKQGQEVQGLNKFSAGSSDQAKLLRTLTALDYLFDRKKKETEPVEEEKTDEPVPPTDVEVLAKLYDSLTFGPIWAMLGDCLTLIHDRSELLHVATILLPMIEGLMVVCKNSGLNDKTGTARLREKAPKTIGSPKPVENSMENLFYTFTEDHRKILNQMVRNTPKLMSGSFALLVNNPKVLDFDNKRNYFNRKLHQRGNVRESHHSLQLNVRRDQVFLDSYRAMHYKGGDEVKHAKLNIRFQGEEGVDAGGVTREWFQVLARQMFNADYALFLPVASDRTTFHPNKMSGVNPEHLTFFKFIGRIIGKALYENRVLDCHFSRAVYKGLLGQSVSVKDMETLDLEYYNSMNWILSNDITGVILDTFTAEDEEFGVQKSVPLIEGGENIQVTEDNKHEYVRLVTEYKLTKSVKEQMENFLKGFHDIVPAELVSIFNEQELELLISGLPDINVDDWRNNTDYHNYTASSQQIQWFWRAVRSFDKEERAKLLQFVTGTSKVPLNGFKELEGMNGWSKFNIHRDYGSKDRLPSSHTCFNQLDLPEYDSYDSLRSHLYTAITQGAEYFGFA